MTEFKNVSLSLAGRTQFVGALWLVLFGVVAELEHRKFGIKRRFHLTNLFFISEIWVNLVAEHDVFRWRRKGKCATVNVFVDLHLLGWRHVGHLEIIHGRLIFHIAIDIRLAGGRYLNRLSVILDLHLDILVWFHVVFVTELQFGKQGRIINFQ